MPNNPSSNVTIKSFAGVLSTFEIRMHINESMMWKERMLKGANANIDLREVHFHGKDYLGFYLPKGKILFNELQTIEEEVKKRIKIYCSLLETGNMKVFIFFQLFVF